MKTNELLDTDVLHWNGMTLRTTVLETRPRDLEKPWKSERYVVVRQWRVVTNDRIVEVTLRNDRHCRALIVYQDVTAEFETNEERPGLEVEADDIRIGVLDRTLEIWREYMRAWKV